MIRPPQKLHNARQQRQLLVSWPDGRQHTFTYTELRSACRCSACRANKARGHLALVDADLVIDKINNLGQGLQLVFSDGHERGIFPWQYLFELGEKLSSPLQG